MSEFYSKKDMQNEYDGYINLLENTEELSVADWIKVNPLHGIKVNKSEKYVRPENQFPATKKAGD
jgi:hypothetical protein